MQTYKLLVLGSILLGSLGLKSQTPSIIWNNILGGNNIDRVRGFQKTSDGGSILVGHTNSNNGDAGSSGYGNFDYWVVKLNSSLSITWKKRFGGSGDDRANAVQQTADGGYIVAGYSNSNDGQITSPKGGKDYWILKLTSTGAISWKKIFGGNNEDEATSIQQTSDGGYIVAGYSYSNNGNVTGNHGSCDYWVVKLSSTGSLVWQKSYGGSAEDKATSIQQTSDGGYILAGYSNSTNGDVTANRGDDDYWVLKLTSTGSITWRKNLGGSNSDEARVVRQTTDGGYIVAGTTWSSGGDVTGNHGDGDFWTVKLTSSGSVSWKKCFGGTGSEQAYDLQKTSDGGYVLAGYSGSNNGQVTGNHGLSDFWIVKITSTGTLSWQKSSGGSNDDDARGVQQNNDGSYIVIGDVLSNNGDVFGNHGSYDIWALKLSFVGPGSGGGTCTNSYEPNGTKASAKAIAMNTNILSQIASSTDKDYLKFTTTSSGSVTVTLKTLPADYDLKLYNSAGTEIGASNNSGTTNETITISSLPAGTYTAYVFSYDGVFSTTQCYTLKATSGSTARMAEDSEEEVSFAEDLSTGFSVYPNPNQGNFMLDINYTKTEVNTILQVMDFTGKRVLTQTLNLVEGLNQHEVSLNALPKGVYLISIQGENWVKHQKMIVE